MSSGIKPRVVFLGSGPVAARSLELLTKHCDIEAVITKPKPAHHRGAFPVLDTAAALNVVTHTVSNKQDLDDLVGRNQFESRIGVLIDFGIIVSQTTIDAFPLGIINSHFSVLPEWRGADPITFSILSGQAMTGVSLMLLVEAMDEGPLISYGEMPLDSTETTPLLTEKLILLSDTLLENNIPRYLEHQATTTQDITGRNVSYSRKLTKDDGIIDWHKPAAQIEREIRAFIEWPKSRTTLAGKDIVITAAHVTPSIGTDQLPGDVTIVHESKEIGVVTTAGTLWIDRLKPAGKQEMTSEAFIAGHKDKL